MDGQGQRHKRKKAKLMHNHTGPIYTSILGNNPVLIKFNDFKLCVVKLAAQRKRHENSDPAITAANSFELCCFDYVVYS